MASDEDGTLKNIMKTTHTVNIKEKETFLYLYICTYVISYAITVISRL